MLTRQQRQREKQPGQQQEQRCHVTWHLERTVEHSKGDAWIQLAEQGMLVFFSLSVSSFNKQRIEQSLCLTLCKLQGAGKE